MALIDGNNIVVSVDWEGLAYLLALDCAEGQSGINSRVLVVSGHYVFVAVAIVVGVVYYEAFLLGDLESAHFT